jgi:hypothetical protein
MSTRGWRQLVVVWLHLLTAFSFWLDNESRRVINTHSDWSEEFRKNINEHTH